MPLNFTLLLLTKKMSENNHISSAILDSICHNLSSKSPINQALPKNGLLHIDRVLPFICVYRYKKLDAYFSRTIKTQSSYIIVDETVEVTHLLDALALIMAHKFETFLVLELWPSKNPKKEQFKISCPKNKAPATLKALEKGFSKLQETFPQLTIKVKDTFLRHPEHLQPLLGKEKAKKTGTLIIGISVPTLYKNGVTQEFYAIFFKQFYTLLSETIKKAVFEFIRVQTTDDFENFLMLGKTHVDEITLSCDESLAKISEDMAFLLRTTPVNSNEEWEKFKAKEFKEIPSFTYRLIALDPEIKKRELYTIPIEKVEDPTISYILRGKRLEIEKQLTMLEERGSKNFRYIGESLYGDIKPTVLKAAKNILKTFATEEHIKEGKRYNCHEFAEQAQIELDYYQKKFPELKLCIEVRDDVAGIMVSKTKLLVNNEMTLDAKRCDALIQHEIGTHILTYCNGKQQIFKQMFEGFAGYDPLQEGLAVLAEYLVGGLTVNRLRLLAARVVAVHSMLKGADFIKTFNLLYTKYDFPDGKAYYITMRVYRGGGLPKDAVYLSGLMELLEYLKNDGKINMLYTGKFNTKHIPLVQELLYREVLKKPELPRFLERKSVQLRLEKLREGIDLTELVN